MLEPRHLNHPDSNIRLPRQEELPVAVAAIELLESADQNKLTRTEKPDSLGVFYRAVRK